MTTYKITIAVVLPEEVQNAMNNLGIEEMDSCVYDTATGTLTARATTTVYNEEA